AWSDRIYTDAMASPGRGQLARQPHQSCFACGVTRVIGTVDIPLQTGNRCDVDDAPVLPLQHLAAGCLRKDERAGQIDVDDLLPLGERHGLRPLAPRYAGVVDKDVDLPEPFDGRIDDGLDLFDIRHIASHPVSCETAPSQRL